MPTATCPQCGATFEKTPQRLKFCSGACYRTHLRVQADTTIDQRFWAKVNKMGAGGCWVWTGGLIRGYGQVHHRRHDGKQQTGYAHRYAWEHFNGPIPDGMCVLHHCDNPPCVNPNHLFLGDDADNLADARAKGRLIDGKHLIKVSDAGMLDIRANYRPRVNGKQLAAKYGITLIHLLRIVNGTARKPRRFPQHLANPLDAVFERVPAVHLPVRGEVG